MPVRWQLAGESTGHVATTRPTGLRERAAGASRENHYTKAYTISMFIVVLLPPVRSSTT